MLGKVTDQDDKKAEFWFDMPPSVNEQYIKTRQRFGQKAGIALSEKARNYRNHVKAVVAQNTQIALGQFPAGDPSVMYQIQVEVYFTSLENKGWNQFISRGQHKGERKSSTRFVNVDDDNRVKFLRDSLCDAIGIPDDRQIFKTMICKKERENPATHVILSVITDESAYIGEQI